MLLGYCIIEADNDSFMNSEQYEVNICDCLDYVKNQHLHLSLNFKLIKRNFDISSTWDGFVIVSEKFKDFCNNYSGINFYKIPNYPSKYLMIVSNIVQFDSIRRETQFVEFNPICKEYNEVVGATPVCLVDNLPLEDGFFRTDIEFGRSYAKGPLLLVGISTAIKLKEQKFKGLYLEKILSEYKWKKNKN